MENELADEPVAEAVPAGAKGKKDKAPPEPMVSIRELYQFAEPIDVFNLVFSVLLALGTGFGQVSFLLMFGGLMDSFGSTAGSNRFKGDPWLWQGILIIGGCLWASSFIYNAMTDWSRERMLVKWKCLYLKAIVRQDVGWYDTNNPTELAPRIGEATKLIEEGMGGKAMIFFEWVGMGISGLVLCFYYNWAVGLVVLAREATPALTRA